MELKDFIKGTLVEIIKAITEAQQEVKESGAQISPQEFGKVERARTNNNASIYEIEFDIGVTATDSSGVKGGIGVFLAGLGVGTKAEASESNIAQNRIKFKIPIAYPLHNKPRQV